MRNRESGGEREGGGSGRKGSSEVKQKGMVSSENGMAGRFSRQREAVLLLFQGGSTVVGLLVRHI